MSPRIPTRAKLALAALLILLTIAATTLASAKCIAKNKPEGEEGEPGGAGAAAAHASPEKKPGSNGGLTTMSVGESVPEIKKDSSDDGAAVNESKKPKSSGGLTTLSVDDSQAEPADSIAEPVEDGTDDGEDESEKKKKKKRDMHRGKRREKGGLEMFFQPEVGGATHKIRGEVPRENKF